MNFFGGEPPLPINTPLEQLPSIGHPWKCFTWDSGIRHVAKGGLASLLDFRIKTKNVRVYDITTLSLLALANIILLYFIDHENNLYYPS